MNLTAPDYGTSTAPANPFAWMHDSICEQVDPDLFFSKEGSAGEANARLLCESCPAYDRCREYAMRQPNLYGVWGGTNQTERKIMRVLYLDLDELLAIEAAESALDEPEVRELVAV